MISSPGTTSGVTAPPCVPILISVLLLAVSTRVPTCSASASQATLDQTVSGKGGGTRVWGHTDPVSGREVVLLRTAAETVGVPLCALFWQHFLQSFSACKCPTAEILLLWVYDLCVLCLDLQPVIKAPS